MKTNLKRILALALTVLMVVGVVPMAIFATEPDANAEQGSSGLDANIKFNAPTASDVKNVIYWNDFNALTPGGAYATTGEQSIFNGSQIQDGTANVLDDGNDGAAISISATGKNGRLLAGDKWGAQSGNSGKSIVLSADFKLPNVTGCRAAAVFTPGDRKQTVPSPILVDTDGSLYLGYVNGEILYYHDNPVVSVTGALPENFKVGGKIGQLSADKFINVAAILDVANNTFSVIIDGTTVADGLTMFSAEKLAAFASIGYANGFGYCGFHVMNSSRAASGDTCIIDNVLIYEGNTFEGTWTYGTDVTSGSVEYECVAPTADAIKAKYGDSAIIFYNNYNALTPGGDFSSAGGIGVNGLDDRTSGTVVSDGKGGAALQLDSASKGGFYTAWDRWAAQTGNSGKNFVMATDIKMGSGTEGAVIPFTFGDRKGTNGSPLFIDKDGTIYLGHNGTRIMDDGVINTSLDATEKAGGAIGMISSAKFTNLAVVINVVNNTMVVYIDGVAVTDALPLFTAEQKATFAANGFENGYGVCQVRMPACNAYTAAGSYVYDNSMVYWGDGYEPTILAKNVGYSAPTAADITSKFGADSLLYYNNFTDKAQSKGGNITLASNSAISDGVLNIEHIGSGAWTSTLFGPFDTVFNNDPRNTEYCGESFVISLDVKIPANGLGQAGAIWTANSRIVNGGAFFSPVLVDSDGTLYLGHNGTTCIETHEASFNAAALSSANKVGGVIGKLSKDKFTNIAVVMNPVATKNTFSVYIDGVCVAKDLRMFSDAKLSAIAATAYADGWIPRQIFLNYVKKDNLVTATMTVDNLIAYVGDSYFEVTTQKGIFSGSEVQGNLNGYVPSNGVIKYYEDGALVKNTTSADGLLTIDENGIVKFGDKNVVSMDEIYTVNAKGELVPAAGVYNGIYTANALLGVKGNDYYFDEDGKVVAGNDKVEVGDKFYEADASGVIKPLTKVETDAETGDKTYYVFGTKCESATEIFAAIPDGETYDLTEDIVVDDYLEIATEDDVEIVIDLAGNELAAEGIVVTGNVKIVDSGAEKGVIKVAQDSLSYYAEYALDTIVAYSEDRGGYVVFDVKDQQKDPAINAENGKLEYYFRPSLDNNTEFNKEFFASAEASNLFMYIDIYAYDENGDEIASVNLYADDALIAEVYADNTKAFKLSISGFESAAAIVITYTLESGTGAYFVGANYYYI